MKTTLLLLVLCAMSALAQDADPRARLAHVIQREQQLLDLLRRVREGSTVSAGELLTPLPAPEPVRPRIDPASAFEQAQLQDTDEVPAATPLAAPVGEATPAPATTPAPAAAPAPAPLPPLSEEHTDPQRLGDAYLAAGQAVAALDAYERAAERAETHGTPAQLAQARYGVGRSLEELGQFDAAIEAYAAVEKLPQAGLWAQAASFARTFIRWRRQVASASAPKETR
ncbi:MAG: hypothetical protein R3F62_07480 [Planctomycetota bacterium]